MATVKFYLKNPKDKTGQLRKDEVSIDLVLTVSRDERERIPTGERIIPKYWDKRTKEVKANFRGHLEINSHLSELKEKTLEVWRNNKGLAFGELRGLVRKAVRGEDQSFLQKKTINEWVESFIKDAPVKDSSKQVYNSSFDHLKNYAAKYNIDLTWDLFDLDFYTHFTKYLWSIGHSDNTVGKVVKTLKTFIREAFDRGLHTNLNFQKKGFKVIHSEADEVYLSEQEINAIHNVQGLSRKEEVSKQMFVFACWVGLRFSDLSKLNPNQVLTGLKGKMLRITTTKTGEDVIIPMHPVAEEIWDSWQGLPPKQISNPKFNKHLKTIAEKAKLTIPVQRRKTVRGKVTIEWVPKYKMVKAHTARRSFATNCYLLGVPKASIMAVTGHKTEKAFNKYLRITKEQHANIMAEFFNKQPEQANMKVG
jgi:site-specific recombinase XerD